MFFAEWNYTEHMLATHMPAQLSLQGPSCELGVETLLRHHPQAKGATSPEFALSHWGKTEKYPRFFFQKWVDSPTSPFQPRICWCHWDSSITVNPHPLPSPTFLMHHSYRSRMHKIILGYLLGIPQRCHQYFWVFLSNMQNTLYCTKAKKKFPLICVFHLMSVHNFIIRNAKGTNS